jgi:hypothetical protein
MSKGEQLPGRTVIDIVDPMLVGGAFGMTAEAPCAISRPESKKAPRNPSRTIQDRT